MAHVCHQYNLPPHRWPIQHFTPCPSAVAARGQSTLVPSLLLPSLWQGWAARGKDESCGMIWVRSSCCHRAPAGPWMRTPVPSAQVCLETWALPSPWCDSSHTEEMQEHFPNVCLASPQVNHTLPAKQVPNQDIQGGCGCSPTGCSFGHPCVLWGPHSISLLTQPCTGLFLHANLSLF